MSKLAAIRARDEAEAAVPVVAPDVALLQEIRDLIAAGAPVAARSGGTIAAEPAVAPSRPDRPAE
jgi:hypothetical protein